MANTFRSPKRSTSFPEMSPEQKRAIANAETSNPTEALFTPKDFANSGIAGMTIPKPTATKNPAVVRTLTSRGSSPKSLR